MFYDKTKEEILKKFDSDSEGLTEKEVKTRLKEYGYNRIVKEKKFSVLKLFLSQFKDPIVIILIFAALLSFLLGEFLDGYIISAILVLNACFGFFQEYKAERAIKLLRELSSPKSLVIRNGHEKIVASKHLVPGDIILLEAGDKISADARLIHCLNLLVDESTLTGESSAVAKCVDIIHEKVPVAEQTNMVFSGTIINAGRAKAIVVGTGMNTELGKIASLVQTVEEVQTPLQGRLKKLGLNLGIITILVCFLVLGVGLLRQMEFFQIFFAAVSLAVSAIPEGLPAVVTITLALGVQRMYKKKALVRRLKAIETLGSTTIICSDKTGTITKNEMSVTDIFVNNKDIKVSDGFSFKGKRIPIKDFKVLFGIAANCNNAVLPNIGDPTEIALLIAAKKAGVGNNLKRTNEVPFNSSRKYMITEHNGISFIKGAPEKVIELCKYYYLNGRTVKLDSKARKKFLDKIKNMTSDALRVLGFAYEKDDRKIFVGLMGMIDPPRPEIKEALELCAKAGIRVVMITGDHKNTAIAIAKQIGIKGGVLEGKQLDTIKNFGSVVDKVNIYARVDPSHKVKILEALQKKGEVVAMTGDGVNDAPALKKADVGVAMSVKGTDVARDASDMVLIDDNFASIVAAVREGRIMYDNIKKFVKFLLAVNFDEIFVILASILMGLPLAMLPIQILWINLVTDSLPALALGVDPAERGIMNRKPRDKKEHILTGSWNFIITASIIAAVFTFGLFLYEYNLFGIEKARTMLITASILFEFFVVWSVRSPKFNFWELKFNKWLVGAVLISLGLHLIVIYTPLNTLFKFVWLGWFDWVKVIGVACTGLIYFEVRKFVKKRKN